MYGFVESKITSKYAPLKTKKFTKFRAEQLDDYKKVTSENTIWTADDIKYNHICPKFSFKRTI